MSSITETIDAYKAGTITWPELVDFIVHFHYAEPRRYSTDDMDDNCEWLYPQEGTGDEIHFAYEQGKLTREEFFEINGRVYDDLNAKRHQPTTQNT